MEFGSFLVTIAPVPTEEKGGCGGALFLLAIWIFVIWLVIKIIKAIFSFIATNFLWILLFVGGIVMLYMYIKHHKSIHNVIKYQFSKLKK